VRIFCSTLLSIHFKLNNLSYNYTKTLTLASCQYKNVLIVRRDRTLNSHHLSVLKEQYAWLLSPVLLEVSVSNSERLIDAAGPITVIGSPCSLPYG